MNRLYTELRIAHNSQEEKEEFERKIDEQAALLGLKARVDYIRHIVDVDAATKILERLKSEIRWKITWKEPIFHGHEEEPVWEEQCKYITCEERHLNFILARIRQKHDDILEDLKYEIAD